MTYAEVWAPTSGERTSPSAALVQSALLALAGPPADPLASWLWDRITESGGQVRIRDLVTETG